MKLLVLIDRYKQVTAVANALNMKQPTISFHMKKMETDWGVKLFQAKSGRIFLTNAGKIMLPYASQISALYTEAESKITELRDNERTLLRVGCTDCAMTTIARSNWLTAVRDKANIQVSMQSGDEQSLYQLLNAGMLDLAICGLPPQASYDFHYDKLAASSLKLILPVGHSLTQESELAPHNLFKYAFIDHTETSISELIALWKAHLHWTINTVAKFESVEMIISAVHAQMGVAILPECVLPDPAHRVVALDLPGISSEWNLYASWRSNYWNIPLIKQIVEFDLSRR
ncbi:LysR family transcriptional regulator [Cohnella silvisoli]|uniref:LysR family transcriptional regulator n=1 Tax=Cohnella silvisoli TaxID=2873699 RepID=A0ABV1L1P1_9BACL|nr:LysR family transcriptional regulator [Cohnella silvisoli]MCD9025901.1 LysR family transcriptional regulator [Cohnella silvisoli]